MHISGERIDEIYAGTLDTVRPVLLKLEKESSVHIYPVTRSLSNPSYKVYDIYAAHHLVGTIELREMHKNRVLVSFCPKQFDQRQVQLGTIPQEILATYHHFIGAFRNRLQDLGFNCYSTSPREQRV